MAAIAMMRDRTDRAIFGHWRKRLWFPRSAWCCISFLSQGERAEISQAALTRARKLRISPSRLSASAARVSASVLTFSAVERASLDACATRDMASALDVRIVGGAMDALGDRGDGAVLLFDRGGDARGHARHFVDDRFHLLDRARGFARRRLDFADLRRDFLGRFRSLAGQRLDLGRHDREAASGFASACGLDRGVEREQVGLAGNGLDQSDHLADAIGGIAKLRHGLDGAAGFGDGARGDLGRFAGLAGDLVDRGGKFLGRAGGAGDIFGGGVDALAGGVGLGGHRVGGAVERAGGGFELTGGGAYLAERLLDRAFELGDAGRDGFRPLLAVASFFGWPAASFSRSTMLSRNTITVRAISPISSFRRVPGMSVAVLPVASTFITPARPLSGRMMLSPISQLRKGRSPSRCSRRRR
ncbi:MAG: hypothetical protein M5U33_12110 [Pseudorhodoplanes sp.]|nr:hypothetical protein [Pseudorhodoplanes sp.]